MVEKNTVPHVYTAMAAILKELKVDKDGKLPGNMGSAEYASASAISEGVKERLANHECLFLSDEEPIKHEVHVVDGRAFKIFTSIKGTYTILSSLDGSSVTVGGVGDGLASSTAVSSNIASTNALKNALLRTFMISENSVEEKSQKEQNVAPVAAAVATARRQAAPVSKAPQGVNDLKARIRDEFIGAKGLDKGMVNDLVKKKQSEGLKDVPLYESVIADLENM